MASSAHRQVEVRDHREASSNEVVDSEKEYCYHLVGLLKQNFRHFTVAEREQMRPVPFSLAEAEANCVSRLSSLAGESKDTSSRA